MTFRDFNFIQEAHGPHYSSEKTVRSINTYNYIITLIKRRTNPYLFFENLLVLQLNKLESPSAKDALGQMWLKLVQWFWIRKFLNFLNVFYYFVIISSWKRAGPFSCRNLNFLHWRMLCAKFGWNLPSASGEEDFKNFPSEHALPSSLQIKMSLFFMLVEVF